jgi:glucose-6-phosphate isomerase
MLGLAREGLFVRSRRDVRERGYERVVLFGMGGSSLAPEVFSKVYPIAEGSPWLLVVDTTTNPDTIARIRDELAGRTTLFIVSTKSRYDGRDDVALRFFLAERGGDANDFIAVTDLGTPLEKEALDLGFWRLPESVRYRRPVLRASFFGLVPASAAGIDVRALLNGRPARCQFTTPITPESGSVRSWAPRDAAATS